METALEEHRTRRREANRKWRLKNPEKARQYAKKSYEKYAAQNRERINKRMRDWRRNNPELNKAQKQRWHRENRARYLACRQTKDAQERVLLVEKYSLGCAYCTSSYRLELDHKYPKSRGGTSDFHNLQWLCMTCNRVKHNLAEDELVVHIKKMLKALSE